MKEIIYRTFCPICKGPLDVPIWRMCQSCDKQKYNRKKRLTYLEKRKKSLYQREYYLKNKNKDTKKKNKYNAEWMKIYRKLHNKKPH